MTSQPQVPEKARRPRHVAIIMDGNGRWALERGLPRLAGHRKGADVVRDITTFSRELKIPFLTLFAFSTQNLERPPDEVAGLMVLLEEYCYEELPTLMKHGIRLHTIGDLSRLPASARSAVEAACEETGHNAAMTLTLALNYGGREEVVAAVQRLARDVHRRRLNPETVDETAIEARLDTALLPDPDLIIRTSGEKRLSNFMLWQAAYAEFLFTDTLWPDFDREALARALWDYCQRERRFGRVADPIGLSYPDSSEGFVLGDLPDTGDAAEKGPDPC